MFVSGRAGAQRGLRVLSLSLVAFLVGPLGVPAWAHSEREAAPGCALGEVTEAAQTLYAPGTEPASTATATVAGLDTSLVLEPLIAPGTRHRMIEAHGQWCDATTGFNSAWNLLGRPRDGWSMAEAYVQLAAAPYFDEVRVVGVEKLTANTFAIRTHARTNGVVADWQVTTAAEGIASATWTAARTGVRPFEPDWEGLTALPGATETYQEISNGFLWPQRGLPTPRSPENNDPGPTLTYEASDGFTIVTSLGDARVAPDFGQDTGVDQLDALRAAHRSAAENYEEFLEWGLEKGWEPAVGGPPDEGYVYIDDALSFYCVACVFIADDFQIHMRSDVVEQLAGWGYTYPDRYQAWSNVMGHEMFHNFQNAYVRPGFIHNNSGRRPTRAYSEGTARFQETLHSYSDVSHQHGSLVTADDSNGCNGFDWPDMDEAMAGGPFEFHSYDSCYFWMSWFAHEGLAGLIDLVTEEMRKTAHLPGSYQELAPAITEAAGDDITTQLIRFARSALTGSDMTWSSPATGESRDWSGLIERWEPAVMAPGQAVTMWLSDGGMMARELRQTTTVHLLSPQGSTPAKASLFVIRQGPQGIVVDQPASGAEVLGPQAGEKVWVGVVYPVTGQAQVTLRFGAGSTTPSPTPKPSTSPTPIGWRTTHSDAGHIELGHPGTYISTGLTARDFLASCKVQPRFPAGTQGLDAFVFTLPDGSDVPSARLRARGRAPGVGSDVDVVLFDRSCRWLQSYGANGDEVNRPVVAGTRFVAVTGYYGVDINVTLDIEAPIWPEPDPTPTGSPSGTPTPAPTPAGPDCTTARLVNLAGGEIGRGVSFANPSDGWVSALSKILVTRDGGKSWEVDHSISGDAISGEPSMLTIAAPTTERAIAAGIGDATFFTHDSGTTWESVKYGDYLPFPAQIVAIRAIDFVDADHGWAVGHETEGVFLWNRAVIVATSDGGRTWTQQDAGEQWLGTVDFVNRQVGYAFGGANLKTIDGGETWTPLTAAPGGFIDVVAISETDVYALSDSGDIFVTTDGGSTWTTTGYLDETALAITGTPERLFVSGQGFVASSPDGGRTWTKELVANGHNLIDVSMRTQNSAVAVGTGGSVIEMTCRRSLAPAQLSFTDLSARSGQYSDGVVFETRLTSADGEPLVNKNVSFSMRVGERVVEKAATTDSDGGASVELVLNDPPGEYVIAAHFAGIPDQVTAAEASMPFYVHPEDAAITVAVDGNGSRKALTSKLSDQDSAAGIAGRTLEYFADGGSLGCVTTDESGDAALSVPPRYRGAGHEFGVAFLGDGFYSAAHSGRVGSPGCAAPQPTPSPSPTSEPTASPSPSETPTASPSPEPSIAPPDCDSTSTEPTTSTGLLAAADTDNVTLRDAVAFGGGTDIDFSGDYVYASEYARDVGTGGVHIVDVSGEEAREVSFVEWPAYQNDVAIVKPGLLALGSHWNDCDQGQGVRLVDVGSPDDPRLLGSVDLPDGTHTLTVFPGSSLIYASPGGYGNGDGVEQIIDVSDPDRPKVVGRYTGSVLGCHDVTFFVSDDRKLGACAGTDETQIWDVTVPTAPRKLSSIVNADIEFHHSVAFTPDGRYLVVGDENMLPAACDGGQAAAVHMYDVTDPAAPVYKSTFGIDRGVAAWLPDEQGRTHLCTAHNFNFVPLDESGGRYLLVAAWYQAGFNVIDWSDLEEPVEIAHHMTLNPTTDYWSAYWYDGQVYANDRWRGLEIFDIEGI